MAIFVYLRFLLAGTADLEDFEGDMRAMAELAETQPGYLWSEMGRSMQDQLAYVVVSEWEDIDDVRAWEHNAAHIQIQHKWEVHFDEPLVHRRFTPLGTTGAIVDPSLEGRSPPCSDEQGPPPTLVPRSGRFP